MPILGCLEQNLESHDAELLYPTPYQVFITHCFSTVQW